jgi:hypothetical protein
MSRTMETTLTTRSALPPGPKSPGWWQLVRQVRFARPAGARSRARRYGLPLGPDDGARVIVS